ncbi:hypothetical protein MES5069_70183 [Mesorhizobium escarrei]|uniref:Uncharacterized protein n=1 Tax=Mesorhizobium escarrei TaxID=666018 RepID=A0ABN8KE94_9HYPH|nr:hypothetical protein MES5069_70183 [Mesorhizobium escarrei]
MAADQAGAGATGCGRRDHPRLAGNRAMRSGDRRGLFHRAGACRLGGRARTGDRPHHSVCDDQHRNHPVVTGGGAFAAGGGEAAALKVVVVARQYIILTGNVVPPLIALPGTSPRIETV